MTKPLSKIKTSPLQRRMALSLAGVKSGSSYALGGMGNLLKRGEKRQQANEALLAKEAKRFVEELGKLKGAYVKIGQMFGIYGQYLLPAVVVDELLSLNDQTAHLNWASINQQLTAELGDYRQDFIIENQPIAAASLGQVHRAQHLPSNHALCFKVQYPGVADAIDGDFRDMITLLSVTRWLKLNQSNHSLIEDIHQLLKQETDYQREAHMCQRHQQLLADDDRYVVPTIHNQYCSPRLLVMDFIEGYKINSPHVKALSQTQRNHLATAILELFFKEIFEWRLMQTDPNFGNYLIVANPKNPQQPRLCLLDFGAVRELNADFMNALCLTIASACEHNSTDTIKGLEQLGCLCPPDSKKQSQTTKEQFAQLCFLLVEPFNPQAKSVPEQALNSKGEYRWQHSKLVKRVAKQAANSALSTEFSAPPPEFALITRKLTGVFSTLSALDAEFNGRDIIEPYIKRWRAEKLNA